ncbi:hypothetical protein ANN_15607 [Periplaneta americana]|uniref:Uncharacterized protein n=1 Tax=Periplaneta americana TaxID=6978 RepID=A0ABQ8SGT8_PERAM|nr:hypothetical protein ANN_15607 [Periplaneta americana]
MAGLCEGGNELSGSLKVSKCYNLYKRIAGVIGPHLFEGTVTGDRYLPALEEVIVPQLERSPRFADMQLIRQQDGEPNLIGLQLSRQRRLSFDPELRSGMGSISAWVDYLVGIFPRLSQTVRRMSDNNVHRLDWLAQSLDLNPIEHLWDELDQRLKSREMRPTSIVQVSAMLQKEWRRIPVDILHKLVESMPDRVAQLLFGR